MLLKMSLSGGILIIWIIILRHLLAHRLPKKVFMLLWGIVLSRLLIPFDLPFKYGIVMPLQKETPVSYKTFVINGIQKRPSLQVKMQDIPTAEICNIHLPVLIWITGTIIFFIIFALLYLKEYHIIREALPVTKEQENNLRQAAKIPERIKLLTSDRISTPLATGIINAGIIFPKLFKPDNMASLKYIITHELVHIKRADNVWKILVLCAACIHWFNPLVWTMYILFNRDLEISCDEKVISLFGDNAKKEYALVLVNFAENQCKWQFFSNGFGKKPVKERIEAIMKYKKLTFPGAICAAIILGTAVTVFAKGSTQKDNSQAAIQKLNNMKDQGENSSGTTPSAIYHCYEGEDNDLSYFASTEEFKEYEKYGLSYNDKTGHLMYDGKIVGYFYDETSKNIFTHITDEAEGESIGIKVIRNSGNEITGFKKTKVPDTFILEPGNPEESNPPIVYSYAMDDSYAVSNYDSADKVSIQSTDVYATFEDDSKDSLKIQSDTYATSTDDADNSALLKDYVKYGITYNKSIDKWQYKGKNIAGFWDKGNEAPKMLYIDSDIGKNSVYIIIDGNSNINEVTEKEFNKIFNE